MIKKKEKEMGDPFFTRMFITAGLERYGRGERESRAGQ
jgi:hypothetical protein